MLPGTRLACCLAYTLADRNFDLLRGETLVLPRSQNWQQGIGVGVYDPDGDAHTVYPIAMVGGRAVFDGVVSEADEEAVIAEALNASAWTRDGPAGLTRPYDKSSDPAESSVLYNKLPAARGMNLPGFSHRPFSARVDSLDNPSYNKSITAPSNNAPFLSSDITPLARKCPWQSGAFVIPHWKGGRYVLAISSSLPGQMDTTQRPAELCPSDNAWALTPESNHCSGL